MTEISACAKAFTPNRCGVNVFIDPQSLTGTRTDCVLILGQIAPDGTAAPGLHQYNTNTAGDMFGEGGTLNQSVEEFLDGCPGVDVYVYAAADPGGTAGTAEITITGTAAATAAGVVYVWVNGQSYSATFDPTTETDADLAAKLAAVIAADLNLNVVANGNVIEIETKETGEIAGFLDVRGVYSCQPGLVSSGEIAVDITSAAGVGVPDFSGLPAISQQCAFVDNPYRDLATMGFVADYLCKTWQGGSNSRAYGVAYDTPANLAAFGVSANNAFFSYVGIYGALTPPYVESASYTCLAYDQLNCESFDVTASMSGLAMPSMLAPEPADLFDGPTQDSLVEAGIGYFDVTAAKDVIIGRAVTTYTIADNGSIDDSLRDVNKPAAYACISRRYTEEMTAKFRNFSLRTDGVVPRRSRGNVATLETIENCMISITQGLSDDNFVQDIPGFIQSLQISIDPETGCVRIDPKPDVPCPLCCMNIFMQPFSSRG